MKANKVLISVLATILSVSLLVGCTNVNTVTKLPFNLQIKEESQKEDITITFEEVNETVYAKNDVIVRQGPSTKFSKVGALKGGEIVTRIGISSNGWSKVIFDGKECYIDSTYLMSQSIVQSAITIDSTTNQ